MFLDENIYWKDHIHTVENKIAKTLGFCFMQETLKTSLKSIYFAYIHPSINYGNNAWVSTHITKSKKSLSVRICCLHNFLYCFNCHAYNLLCDRLML